MVTDRVRLDRRLGEAAEELEQVGVGGHATQEGGAVNAAAGALGDPVVCPCKALELRADGVHNPDPFVAQKTERRCDGDGRQGGWPGRAGAELFQHEDPLGWDELEVPGIPGDVVLERGVSGGRIGDGHGDSSFAPG